MEGEAVQHIAAAVTPAVMVSACGLIALGLDAQAGRMATRVREMIREHREHGANDPRLALVRRQVAVLGRRHTLLASALTSTYGAMLAFVTTSLLSLGQGLVALPPAVPLAVFAVGVLLLAIVSVLALGSLRLARAAIRMEIEALGRDAEPG